MRHIDGFAFTDCLARGRTTAIYRGTRLAGGDAVVAKINDLEFPAASDLARLRREFELLGRLVHPSVIKVHSLERTGRGLAIIMEDAGVPLRTLIQVAMPLERKVAITRKIVEALGYVHAQGVIHRDVNPDNILVDGSDGVRLIDFGSASNLAEISELAAPDSLEGTLAYIAPEQTGRMSRPVDHRADFYSLGVTLYEWLLGRLPFTAQDSIELVHQHLAALPPPLHILDPAIPVPLSRIVAKLLDKNAENRYRSAAGLISDLDLCLGAGDEFVPGRKDPCDRFAIPTHLYGRDAEMARLLAAYGEARRGERALVLVKGSSGIGKSALIHEIHRPIAQDRGLFVSGKFDQYQRDVPYSALLKAFHAAVRQILAADDAVLGAWRERLGTALGAHAGVLVEVIPDLERIIGPQPEAPTLSPQESETRFHLCITNFVHTLATIEHPLVLFLDDLQWADSPSLQLLERLSTDRSCGHLLILGAFRDNEVSSGDPLLLAVDRIRQTGIQVEEIALPPLSADAVTALLADTLHRTPEDVAELARLVKVKTEANPFFIGQLLTALHARGDIRYRPDQGDWTWDETICDAEVSDNVADLMAARLRELPSETRTLLRIAACLGNEFSLADLASIGEKGWDTVAEDLAPALSVGLVTPVGGAYRYYGGTQKALPGDFSVRYRFLHDRIQQSAYDQLGADERRLVHFQAGKLLLEQIGSGDAGDRLFDIVGHFNRSECLVTDPELRRRLAELNLHAARRAKASIAYTATLSHAEAARILLGDLDAPNLRFRILAELADGHHLTGDAPTAEVLFRDAVAAAPDHESLALAYERMIHFYTNIGKFHRAYAIGREAVGAFGVALPGRFQRLLFLADLLRVRRKMWGRPIESLVDLPLCADSRARTAMRLIAAVLKAAYQVKPELCVACAVKAVDISLTHGTMEDNAVAYVVFGGIFLGGVMGKRRDGYAFGHLAQRMNERFGNRKLASEIAFVSAYFTAPWIEPAAVTEQAYRVAYDSGLASGDFFHLACAACTLVESQLIRGVPLDEVRRTGEGYRAFLERIGGTEAADAITAVLQTAKNLQGETDDPASFSDEAFDEPVFAERIGRFTSRHFAHFYFVNRMLTLYLHGLTDKAQAAALESESYLKDSIAMLHTAEHHFLHGLILCARLRQGGTRALLRRARAAAAKLDGWASINPPNFLARALLLRAEIEASAHGTMATAALYERAITAAQEHGSPHIEALAHELAGRFLARHDLGTAAAAHFRSAHYGYRLWGAHAVADRLVRELPHLTLDLGETNLRQGQTVSATFRTTRTADSRGSTRIHSRLDIETALKATRALSSEIKLTTLLQTLVGIMIENAGAQSGSFLRVDQGQLTVEASGCADEAAAIIGGEPPDPAQLPLSVLHYVARLGESVVLSDVDEDQRFWNDPYLQASPPKSLLCAPVLHQGQVIGLIYLENQLTSGAFTEERLEMLEVLAAQAGVSIENSLLYGQMEHRVTERTAELRRTAEKLDAANKAKSRFLATMSHEIRTPMTGVLGMLDLLQHTPLNNEQRDMVEVVRESAATLLTILNDILDFSKIEAGRMELERVPLALDEVIESVAEVLAPTAYKKGLSFTTVIDPTLPPSVLGDPVRLRQILFNLIGNAIKFTDAGSVVVRANRICSAGHDQIRIAVSDSGVGISPVALERLFKPFAQADATTTRRYGGTGLGLSICLNLVELMAGTIKAESEPGMGATFQVTLPLTSVEGPTSFQPELHDARVNVDLSNPAEAEAARLYLTAAGATVVDGDQSAPLCLKDGRANHAGGVVRLGRVDGTVVDVLSRPLRRNALLDALSKATETSPAPAAATPPQTAVIPRIDSGKRILVAEDNPINQIVIKRLLQSLGYEPDLVANGILALEAWRNGDYAVILSDCHMPEMDGFELTRIIRTEEAETGSRTPIVAFTAATTVEEITQCTEAGMDDFLSKPIEVERLKAILDRWL